MPMAAPKANKDRTVGADVLTNEPFPNPVNWTDRSYGSYGSDKADRYIGTNGRGRAANPWIGYA